MTSHTFKIIAYENSGLHSLILRHSKNWLDDPLLMPIFDTCSKLTKLDLTGKKKNLSRLISDNTVHIDVLIGNL